MSSQYKIKKMDNVLKNLNQKFAGETVFSLELRTEKVSNISITYFCIEEIHVNNISECVFDYESKRVLYQFNHSKNQVKYLTLEEVNHTLFKNKSDIPKNSLRSYQEFLKIKSKK